MLEKEIDLLTKVWQFTPSPKTSPLGDEDSGPSVSDQDSSGQSGHSSDSTTVSDELLPKKTKICRHYLRGHCKRGDACNFLHDVSVFKPDEQKLFLGGLPKGITSEQVVSELERQGYGKVLNEPRIHSRGFTPKVCMETPGQARELVKRGKVEILGKTVDVRPYKDKKGEGPEQRAVFIGGLPIGTNGAAIAQALAQRGFHVRKVPVVRDGYAPCVEMWTVDAASSLVTMKRIRMFGKYVDVRPYVSKKSNGRHFRTFTASGNSLNLASWSLKSLAVPIGTVTPQKETARRKSVRKTTGLSPEAMTFSPRGPRITPPIASNVDAVW